MPLFMIHDRDGEGREVEVVKDPLVIGRSQRADVRIEHKKVSNTHASIRRGGRGFILKDLGSTNGTFLNGEKIAGEAPLKSGDRITLGVVSLTFFESREDVRVSARKESIGPKREVREEAAAGPGLEPAHLAGGEKLVREYQVLDHRPRFSVILCVLLFFLLILPGLLYILRYVLSPRAKGRIVLTDRQLFYEEMGETVWRTRREVHSIDVRDISSLDCESANLKDRPRGIVRRVLSLFGIRRLFVASRFRVSAQHLEAWEVEILQQIRNWSDPVAAHPKAIVDELSTLVLEIQSARGR